MEAKEVFKQLRKDHGLNQEQFAKLIGVAQSYVSRIESGKTNISFESLQKHLKVFGKKLKISL